MIAAHTVAGSFHWLAQTETGCACGDTFAYFFLAGLKSLTRVDKIVEITEMTIAARMAASGPEIVSPGMMAAATQRITAFTTKVKSPKVTMLIGAVKISSSGLIKVLITPKTIADNSAVGKFSTPKPGTKKSAIIKVKELRIRAMSRFILVSSI